MTRDEIKQLKVGDGAAHPLRERVTHPAFIGFLTIAHVEISYDDSTLPPAPWTDAFTTDTGHRMEIGDEQDVRLLRKLP